MNSLKLLFYCLLIPISSSLFAGTFDTLFTLDIQQGSELAFTKFNQKLLKLDTNEALADLDSFHNRAKKENNSELLAIAKGLKGVYHYFHVPNMRDSSILMLQKGIDLSKKLKSLELVNARFSNLMAVFLFRKMSYQESLELALNADHRMQKIGYENISGVDLYLYNMAVIYFGFDQFQKAINYLNNSLKFSKSNNYKSKKASFNLLGVVYSVLDEKQKALDYFMHSKSIIINQEDSLDLSTVNCNIGILMVDMEQADSAMKLLKHSFKSGKKHQSWYDAATASLWIAKINIDHEKLNEAEKWLDRFYQIMSMNNIHSLTDQKMYFEERATLAEKRRDFQSASIYKDSIQLINDSLNEAKDLSSLISLNLKLISDNYQSERKLMEREADYQALIRNIVIAISVLIVLLLSYFWHSTQKKRKLEQKMFTIEYNKTLEKLNDFRNRIREKNNLLEKVKNNFDQLKISNEASKSNIEIINRLSEHIILTDSDWLEFKKLFELAYPKFLQKVQNEFPELTNSEIRLLALIKLNLSINEMANTLAILPQSVRKTRQRLMKKLEFSHQKELRQFISSI